MENNKIRVMLIYPSDFELDNKDLDLNQMELSALMASEKVGSEGKYFKIDSKIFEDASDGFMVSIILENL